MFWSGLVAPDNNQVWYFLVRFGLIAPDNNHVWFVSLGWLLKTTIKLGFVWFGCPRQQLMVIWFGLDWIGLVWIGLIWIGLIWIELNWIGLI